MELFDSPPKKRACSAISASLNASLESHNSVKKHNLLLRSQNNKLKTTLKFKCCTSRSNLRNTLNERVCFYALLSQ